MMVSYSGYEILRHKKQVVKPFLSENACFFVFFFFSTIKVKPVDRMKKKIITYVPFYMFSRKTLITLTFLPYF